MRHLSIFSVIFVFLAITGCMNRQSDATRVESDFGESVRIMQESQVYHPKQLEKPSLKTKSRLDGDLANTGIESYRKPPP